MSRFRDRLTYANMMATVAVFIALGAGAYAAGLPKNSVKSKQIKAGAVKTDELGDDAVTSPKVTDGTLLGADFAAGQLPQGQPGEQGPQGLPGDDGAPGSPGPTFAAVADEPDPAVAAESFLPAPFIHSFTTPTAGKLLAMFSSERVSVACTAGDPTIGLYMDRVPILGTRRSLTSATFTSVDVFGLTATRAAGPHTLEVGADCPGGNVASTGLGNEPSLGVVLIGQSRGWALDGQVALGAPRVEGVAGSCASMQATLPSCPGPEGPLGQPSP